MSNLAFAQYAQGKRRLAIDLLRATLTLRRDVLGAKHPDVAGDAASLAYWLIDAGSLDEAAGLVDESLAIRRQQLGERHPSVATTLAVKASLLLAQRHYRAAADAASEAEDILSSTQDASQWRMAMAMNAHGAALAGLGQFQAGEKLLRDSLPGLEGAPISGLTEKGRERLRQLYQAWGKPDQAEQHASR
jgi:tetratricopeptide (TPR) repeat protein